MEWKAGSWLNFLKLIVLLLIILFMSIVVVIILLDKADHSPIDN